MTSARLLTLFTLDATNNTIVVNHNAAGNVNVTVNPGTYYWSIDGTVAAVPAVNADFSLELETRLDAAIGAGAPWAVEIIGVDTTDSTKAEGRVLISTAANDFDLIMSAAGGGAWTMNVRIMGWPTGNGDESSASSKLASDYCHRYGWYPQTEALEEDVRVVAQTDVHITTGRFPDGIDDGEHGTISLGFDRIHPALASIDDAKSANATDMFLTPGDTNCPFERWGLDARDTTSRWRSYRDSTDTANFQGPYIFGRNSPLWSDPLGTAIITERAGKRRTITLSGMEAGS